MEKNHQEKFIQQYGAYYFKDSMSDSKEKRESKDNYKIGRFKRIDEESRKSYNHKNGRGTRYR